jgi:hypothetical protein
MNDNVTQNITLYKTMMKCEILGKLEAWVQMEG